MLAALTLISVLASAQDAAPTADKVNFAHKFTKGESLAYDFSVKGDTDQGAMELNASFTLVYGEKSDKGTGVTVSPKSLKMKFNENEMDQTSSVSDSKLNLDVFGLPDELAMEGASGVLSIPFVLCFLPNKELKSGEAFDVKWKKAKTSFDGKGTFEGQEKVGDKSVSKLAFKGKFSPDADNPSNEGDMEYAAYFDPGSGHIVLVKGKVTVGTQSFNLVLTKK